MSVMTLVMFDVDGTLTQSNELDTRCSIQALGDVFEFSDVDDDWSNYRHTSDSGIIEELFQQRRGCPPTTTDIARYKGRFFELLTTGLATEPMIEIAGAGRLLAGLARTDGQVVALASGAWRNSARAKMLSAGLPFDDFPGGFGEDAAARVDIMRAAYRHAARVAGVDSFARWLYFGDADWDVRACRELGIPLIGIGRRMAALKHAGALAVFADYSQPDAILATIARANSLSTGP